MGLLHGIDTLSLKGRRSSNASADDRAPDGNPNDTSTLDKEEGNILMALISQLRVGMDLQKIALPTFVLEPRSLLERITDFFSHPELIFKAGDNPDEKERFLAVMTYYLSGWHIKPKGVKKPYNPVLGEIFRCSYFYADGSEGFYVAEQVSHHPPISAFFYVSPKNGVLITGELKPKSKFLGNSAATIMEGENRVRLLNKPEDGVYSISMPNMYARGILFGKMVLELGDTSSVSNANTGYSCDVEFKTKGWISGGYNNINGKIRGPNKLEVGDISGYWSSVMEFTEKKTGNRSVLFDANSATYVPKSVLPEDQQEERESRRLWAKLTQAIKTSDMAAATIAKSEVEDAQRELAKKREANGESAPEPRFFMPAGEKWMPKIGVDTLPSDPDEMANVVRKWIYGDNAPTPSTPVGPANPTASTSVAPTAPTSVAPTAPTSVAPTAPTSVASSQPITRSTSTSPVSNITDTEPPAVVTAPGPPAPGPKLHTPPPPVNS